MMNALKKSILPLTVNVIKKMGLSHVKPTNEQADELQALIKMSREERDALRPMLTQIKIDAKNLSQVGTSLQQVHDRAGASTAKLEELSTKLSAVEERTEGFEQIEGRIRSLGNAVGQAEQRAEKLLAPGGDLQTHRQAVQKLTTQIIQTTANVDALQKEKVVLDRLRDDLRQAQGETKDSADKTVALKGDFDKLQALASQLREEHEHMKESLRATREEAGNTTQSIRDVEDRLGPLAELYELSKTTEERLATLNSLAEHVMQKVKVLENQKHTVEHAVVESNRLSEMFWNMNVQIGKLNEGSKQAAQADETLSRIEHVSNEVTVKLKQAQKMKEAFSGDLTKLEKGRAELSEFVKGHFERLALERKQFESFDQRVETLQNKLGVLERSFDSLAAKEKGMAAMGQKTAHLSKQLTRLSGRAEQLQGRQNDLAALDSQLAKTKALGVQVTRQHETLVQGRKELDPLRKELDEFYKTQTEIAKIREQIGADRTAFEAFLKRTEEFRHHIPEIDSQMDAVMERLSVVDEGTQKAVALVTIADDLDKQMTRLATHQQLAEKIDIRLNALNELSVSVDKHLEEQVARRNEVEALKNQCDGLDVQVSDTQQKLQAVSGLQHKLLPLTTQIATIRTQMGKATTAFKEVQQDETELAAQGKRLTELADRSRDVATTVDERLKQIQSVSKELGRASTVKEELLHELGHVQARQRDVDAHVKTSEDQIKRVDQQLKQLDQRHSQLSFSEKKVADFEERLAEVKTINDDVERQIQALATRETFVRTVKKEVDEVHQISQRSRADLQHVVDHRTQVDALRKQLDDALKSVGETEERMAVLETRKKLVDEVQLKTNVIVNVLQDVRVNLEMLGEQRAVVDHVVESMSRFDETVQSAQATLKALQTEGELGERIERSIKLLRSKTAAAPPDAERQKSA